MTFEVENSQGYLSTIEIINEVYDDETDQYYTQLKIDNTVLWLTKDQADNMSYALESKYSTLVD